MAIPTPLCSDGPNELLAKILLGLPDIGGGGSSLEVDDEGVPLTLAAESIDFVGAGVTATAVGNDVTVTILADVVGPAGAVNNNLAAFDGVTGKLIKDSGIATSSIITSGDFQGGTQAIGLGVDTISVVFAPAFAVAPVSVVATISRPAAEGLIEVNIDKASITAAGFTATLSATTPSANYNINWMAS